MEDFNYPEDTYGDLNHIESAYSSMPSTNTNYGYNNPHSDTLAPHNDLTGVPLYGGLHPAFSAFRLQHASNSQASFTGPQNGYPAFQHIPTSQTAFNGVANIGYNMSTNSASMNLAPVTPMTSTPSQLIGNDQIEAAAQQIESLLHKSAIDPEYMPATQIQGEADYKLKMQAYMTLCDGQVVHQDAVSDFPLDQQTQQKLVKDLITEMIYLGADCEDANSKKSVNRLKKLSPFEFDLMAWKVLLECRDIQQGNFSMPR